MKFLHLGDLHIGKSLSDFDLIEDQEYILKQIIDIAVNNSVDAILVAGDVYDKSIPAESAVKLLDHFINEVVEKKIKLYIITGNHDSDERLNFGSSMFESKGVFISAKFDGKLHKYEIGDKDEKVNIYLMPFIKDSHVRHFYPDAEISTYDDAVRVVIENSDIDYDATNILVAHQFVAGKSESPKLAGSEGMATQNVGLVEVIGYDCFDAFNYVALGHIHSAQHIGREEIRYSGSPLKYSLSEANHKKTCPVVTVDGAGKVDIKLENLVPMRDLRHIKGKMEQLLAKENVTAADDYIYATLTDEDYITDAMGIFQQVYPNTVRIDYENKHTREIHQVDIENITDNKTFEQMISEFYRQMYGCDISEEEYRVMQEIARKAGVDDEAN